MARLWARAIPGPNGYGACCQGLCRHYVCHWYEGEVCATARNALPALLASRIEFGKGTSGDMGEACKVDCERF